MAESHLKAKNTVEKALEASESLNSIVEAVITIFNMNDQIASVTEQQSVVAKEIDQRIVAIAGLFEKSSMVSEQIRNLSQGLKQHGQEFQACIKQFKVEDM